MKIPDKIEQLRQEAWNNEKALLALMDHFRVGVTKEELARVCRRTTGGTGNHDGIHVRKQRGRRASYPMCCVREPLIRPQEPFTFLITVCE